MQFRLIGTVEIDSGGQVIEIGPPQQRLLAAALAVDAGRLVTVESLIDRVWDDAPQGARRTLHVLISKMRRVLEHAGDREPDDVTVVRRSGGYVLQLSPSQVDLLRFRRLADDARRADSPTRVTLLRDAVALWHGEPLSGLPGNWAARARAVWWQEYLEVAVAWANAELQSGDPPATISTLTMLAGEYPLAESVSAALMRALCAVGRPADALACYAQTRERLADELGIDPGPELQAAYQAALRDTSRLPDGIAVMPGPATVSPGSPADDQRGPAAPVPAQVPAVSAAPPPRELPAVVRHFTGRARELEALTAMLDDTSDQMPAAVVISAIGGTAGVGKTTPGGKHAYPKVILT
ncbi:MAG TPA: BTAD domain-containing putative transcriptional regulator [Streptosporangiaceae bacterium]